MEYTEATRRRVRSLNLAGLLGCLLVPIDVGAQVLPASPLLVIDVPPTDVGLLPERPGEQRPALPEELPPRAEGYTPPAVVAPPAGSVPVTSGLSVKLERVELHGNTVFTDEELRPIISPYEGRVVTSEDLEALRQALTRHYIDHGYVSSGALIPDQDVDNGVIRIDIVEAHLVDIELTGNKWLRDHYLKPRLALGAGGVVNVRRLQERIRLLHEDPLIERIDAQLTPGLKPGENVLRVDVRESRPYALTVNFDNRRSPSVGELRGQLYGEIRDLTGFGDSLSLRAGLTEGLNDYGVSYAVPISRYDTRLRVFYDLSDSTVIEEPFDLIDISTDSRSHGIEVSQPLYRRDGLDVTAGLMFEHQVSETTLLGLPFSFSEGPHDGRSVVSALRFWQELTHRSPDQVIAARSTLSLGTDLFGATLNPEEIPDGRFFSWQGQFQWVRRLPVRDAHVLFRTDWQLSPDALLPLEQFGAGGATTVRGYRENTLVRDNGVVGSIELRVPLFRLPIPRLSQAPEDGMIRLAPFLDAAWTSNNDRPTPEPEAIWSAGIGLRWDPHPRLHSELYWGQALKEVDTGVEDNLQDQGIHFQLISQLL